MKVQPELVDVLFRGLDALEGYLANILDSADEGTEENQDIINSLNEIVEKGTGKSSQPAPAASEPAKQETPAQESGALYESITISDYEINTFEKAKEQNMNIYGITVYLQETCILKAARAFLVFKALEDLGEVMKAVPDVQDIEDEKFDMNFSLIYFTQVISSKEHFISDSYMISAQGFKPFLASSSRTDNLNSCLLCSTTRIWEPPLAI